MIEKTEKRVLVVDPGRDGSEKTTVLFGRRESKAAAALNQIRGAIFDEFSTMDQHFKQENNIKLFSSSKGGTFYFDDPAILQAGKVYTFCFESQMFEPAQEGFNRKERRDRWNKKDKISDIRGGRPSLTITSAGK